MNFLCALLLTLILSPQITDTVAVTISPDKPAVILEKSVAEDLYSKLKDGSNPTLFQALTVALGKLPTPILDTPDLTPQEQERFRWQRRAMQGKVK